MPRAMNGFNIPTLCHLQSQTPVGVCRLCVVDTGARVLAASCVRPVRTRHEGGHEFGKSFGGAQKLFWN